jgi:predicted nucleic acid-binding protein
VTTHWVLVEVANFFAGSQRRLTATQFIASLLDDREMVIVPATSQAFFSGWDLYQARTDKSWSLTDCISYYMMRERGLVEALSSDHHFEQAGFQALLK